MEKSEYLRRFYRNIMEISRNEIYSYQLCLDVASWQSHHARNLLHYRPQPLLFQLLDLSLKEHLFQPEI